MLEIQNLSKKFGEQIILDKVDLKLHAGTSYAIIGRSGEGKSTLLHILGTLEKPDEGHLFIEGKLVNFSKSEEHRKSSVGFIFQNYNVLEDFSVIDNLKIAARIRGQIFDHSSLQELLVMYGLYDKRSHLAKVLSGGEKQRLAIARACMHNPKIVLADEPTGSLDTAGAKQIEDILLNLSKTQNTALVIVTHDLELAKKCDKILHLKDGKLK
jgi:lipoprotein-releasing system ATP-binding protein